MSATAANLLRLLCGVCSCGGDGRQRVRRRVRIRVPAGVAEGQVLCVRGQGHAGRLGGPAGNLHVKLQVGLRKGLWGLRA
jgi:DnaJ-class molecular chaperone